MKGNHRNTTIEGQQIHGLLNRFIRRSQFIIDFDTNGLEDLFSRMTLFLSSLAGLADLIISANSVVVSIGLIARACSIFRAICLENLSSPYLKKCELDHGNRSY